LPSWRSIWCCLLALAVPSLCSAHESVDATLWMQTSAEYRVLVQQIFDQAKRRLPDALAAPPKLGAIQVDAEAASKKPAVVLDIDEAVFDNGPWQALNIIRGKHGFDPVAWNEWLMSHKSKALPGALDYVLKAHELGIEVFYVTNRTCTSPEECPQQDATIRNLTDLGFPDVDDARLLMKNERADWISEKNSRMAEIAKNFRIVQIIGDDLGDFIPGMRTADAETRRAMAARYRERFGYTWYLIPNPLYGSWKKALGTSPVSHLQPDREDLCLGPYTPVGYIQGPGDASFCTGLTVTTRGVVTLVSTGESGLGGYFIQDAEGDGNPEPSDGIFVVDRDNRSRVAAGDLVEIRAQVSEPNGLTGLAPKGPGAVTVRGRRQSVRPTAIRLPVSEEGGLECLEGMLVSVAQPMTVTGKRWLAELGQLQLASAGGRGRSRQVFEPSHPAPPGSREAGRIRKEEAPPSLVLDDGKGGPPDPLPFAGKPDEETTLRVGDQVTDILGVLDYGEIAPPGSGDHRFGYRIQATRPPTLLPRRERPRSPEADARIKERAAAARAFLASIEQDPGLQAFLEGQLDRLLAGDARARRAKLGVALMVLEPGRPPRLAHWNGHTSFYPASVVKFVYLMAAYAWKEQGKLRIDGALDRQLQSMIYKSSNTATQEVVRRLTGTEAGPALTGGEYAEFRERRMAVKRWLEGLGVAGIHSIHPTYNGGGDLFGRDLQLMRDASVKGGLPSSAGSLPNRQAMTPVGTVELLALLASDLGLRPEDAAEVRRRMQRDPRKQPYQAHRIAGGALKTGGVEVYSKSGTWGPIFADAGIIHGASGKQLVLAVFIDSEPAYRGDFIAELSRACTSGLLEAGGGSGAVKRAM
jgi:5'-nucleotidase (lipoprotein e(P4) family)